MSLFCGRLAGGGKLGGGEGTRLADVSSFVQMTQTWRHMFVSFPGSPTRCFMFQWENFFGIRSNTITLIVMETEYTAHTCMSSPVPCLPRTRFDV